MIQKNPFETLKIPAGALNKNLNLSFKRTDKIDNFLLEIKGKKKVHIEKDIDSPLIISEFSWLLPGLIVKIKDKTLDSLNNKKAVVKSVEGFAGVVEVIEGKENLKIDQKMLETVIPVRKIKKFKENFCFFLFFYFFLKKLQKIKKSRNFNFFIFF